MRASYWRAIVLGGSYGCFLTSIGFSPFTWQFWPLLIFAQLYYFHGILTESKSINKKDRGK